MEIEKLQKTYEEFLKSSDKVLVEEDTSNIGLDAEKESVKQTLRANSDKWKNMVLRIAVTGRSGAGKSAFINALCGIEAEDKGGAKVDVTETTTDPKPYKHPNNPNFIVWDMPGVDSPYYPKESYFERIHFDQYDLILIVSTGRFTYDDLWLAKQTKERKVRFYFIRSKIDVDIHSDSRAHRKSHSPEKVFCTVRDDCYRNLMEAGIESPKVFLVDNHDTQSYDFGPLEAQLVEDFGSTKTESMSLSLSTVTKEEQMKTYKELVESSDEVLEKEKTSHIDIDADARIGEEIRKLHNIMEEQGIKGVKQALRANCDKWKNMVLHVAVAGSSGAGKSAFINALRGIDAEDKDGAKVDGREKNTDPTPYKHPNHPNFIVWDMPGVGTPKFPKATYLERVKFDEFDFVMIVSRGRFTEDDLWLAKQTQVQKKQFYFIRSNIDTDIYSDSRANRKSHLPKKVLCTVRDDCYMNLIKAGIKVPKVFLVDNHDTHSYDFGPLEAQLLEDSNSIKIESMAFSLLTLTRKVLQTKKEVLEGRIDFIAREIACEMSFSRQRQIYEREISLYKCQFNLDDKTLQDIRVILKLSEENLTKLQTFVKTTSGQTAEELMNISLRESPFKRFIRMVRVKYGLGINKSIPAVELLCLSLQQNLDEMYKMALHVYDVEAQKGLVHLALTPGKNPTTK